MSQNKNKYKRRDTDKLYDKFKGIFVQSYFKSKNSMIFDLGGGVYEFFGKYKVIEDEWITVHRYRDSRIVQFSKLRTAVAWVTIDSRNNFMLSNRVLELEVKLTGLDVEIANHRELINRGPDLEKLLVYKAKLGKEVHERKQIQAELDKYITTAKLWQLKEIDNATKRTQPK